MSETTSQSLKKPESLAELIDYAKTDIHSDSPFRRQRTDLSVLAVQTVGKPEVDMSFVWHFELPGGVSADELNSRLPKDVPGFSVSTIGNREDRMSRGVALDFTGEFSAAVLGATVELIDSLYS